MTTVDVSCSLVATPTVWGEMVQKDAPKCKVCTWGLPPVRKSKEIEWTLLSCWSSWAASSP